MVLLVALVGAAGFAVPGSAWATTGHSFVGEFGGQGTGDGQFSQFGSGPVGVGVLASTGEVFTVDLGAGEPTSPRVQRFSAGGAFLSKFPITAVVGVGPLAVDPAGAVYVSVNREPSPFAAVAKYSVAGVFAYELDASGSGTTLNNPLFGPVALAVDPVDGSVYVSATHDDGRRVVDRFDGATGEFIDFFDGNGSPDGVPFCGPLTGLAVDGSHRVYVLDSCASKNRVDRFSASGVWEATLDPALPLRGDGSAETLSAVAVDSVSDEVFVSHTGPVGTQVTHFGAGGGGVEYTFDALMVGGVRALAVGGGGMVFTSDSSRPFVQRFGRFDGPTVVTSAPPSSVEARSAVLEGTIDPEGVESTYHFEYGLDQTYGSSTGESDPPVGGSDPVAASVEITGLQPNKTYHYRLVGSNGSGSIAGADREFTTLAAPPDVGESFVSAITPRSVRLHGEVNPNNSLAGFYFEYGTTAAYGNESPQPFSFERFVGSGGSFQPVLTSLAGLEPGTTYHYRLVAADGFVGGGTPVFGVDRTFVTAPAAGGGASGVTAGRASLTGTIDPHGVATSYHFNYGQTSSYGASTSEVDAGDGDGDRQVLHQVSGLSPDTTYHVQVVATSVDGAVRTGGDGVFRTAAAPTATAIAPVAIGTSTATLVGDLNTFGVPGSYHFEVFSLDNTFSVSTPVADTAGSAGDQRVRVPVTGLPSGTTFKVVLVVESNDAIDVGPALTFETQAFSRSFSDNAFAYPPEPAEPAAEVSVKFASALSAKARKKASRSGLLPVKVSTTSAGIVTLTARAKLGKKMAQIGRVSKRVKAGAKTQVTVLLNSRARQRLRSGKSLRVRIAVRQSGARTRTTSILLPGVTS